MGVAVADLLFGAVSPSGRLSETWPINLDDVPSQQHFADNGASVRQVRPPLLSHRSCVADACLPRNGGLPCTRAVLCILATMHTGLPRIVLRSGGGRGRVIAPSVRHQRHLAPCSQVVYREGLNVGYRYFSTADKNVEYPSDSGGIETA
jgi:hypothetical protein